MNLDTAFKKYLAPTSRTPMGLAVSHAKGIYLYDNQNNAYIDAISGISVSALGHKHPVIEKALKEQIEKYQHVMVYGEYVLSPQVQLAQALAQTLHEIHCVYFTSSGSEAIEGAMKLAKRITQRKQFICFENAYHGSTQGALSLAGNPQLKTGYQPLLPHIKCLPFNDIAALQAINTHTAAVCIEIIQGEGGVRALLPEVGQALQNQCRKTNTLLIVDEAQTGLGRTGSLWAHQALDIQPDILVTAKALGGGLPLGAFIARKKHMQCLAKDPPMGHITTFGGHPLACATGLAFLQHLRHSKLIEDAKTKAQSLHEALQRLGKGKMPTLIHQGLLMALPFKNARTAQAFVRLCFKNRLLIDPFLFAPHAIRLAPPLSITQKELTEKIAPALYNSYQKLSL